MTAKRSNPRGGYAPSTPTTTMFSVFGLFVIAFLADWLSGGLLAKHLLLYPNGIVTHPWQLITTNVVPYDILHILSTLIVLGLFGTSVEQRIGRRRVLVTMFGSAVVGAFVAAIVGQFVWKNTFYAGWDGPSMALLGAWGVIFAAEPMALFGTIQIRSTTMAAIFLLMRVISDYKSGQLLGIVGGVTAAVIGALLSGYGGRLMPLIRDYRDKLRKKQQRKGFVVIDGGKRPNEPRFWN